MKKLSLRMRMTVLTSLCLSIACIVMMLALFWLADMQVVQYIEMEVTDISPEAMEKLNLLSPHFDDQYLLGEEILSDSAREVCDDAVCKGLLQFYSFGLGILIIVVILGSVMAWVVSGWSIAPVKKLSMQIDNIDEQKLATHIEDFSAGDELQKLADSFNSMLKRLDNAFEREKRFSAAAAHELKTPLTVMKASIDVLELSDEPTLEEYQETIGHMKKQIARLTALVMDLLAFSRCHNFADQSKICLDQVLQKLLEELKVSYPAIVIEKGQIDRCTVMGNPAIVERAVFNLLDNAAKFSPLGGKIYVQLTSQDNNTVFCVKDEGVGISKSAAEHIFEPFYREDQSRNRQIAGAGLGLAFVKEFTDTYGGTITFSNNIPCGSVFTLSLPQKN